MEDSAKRLYSTVETDVDQRKTERSTGARTIKPWLPDLLSIAAAALFLAILIGLLYTYDHKPSKLWHGVTLNFLVSILAQATRTAIAIPLADCLGQLKWYWFWAESRPRGVTDFQAYDDASRSAWGSLVMLCRPQLWHVASIGALLMVATLATEPFLQQMPTYPVQMVNASGTALVNVTSSYYDVTTNSAGTFGAFEYEGVLPDTAKGAIFAGVYGASSALSVQPRCSTGNCTWETYSTLGVCSACANLSSMLVNTVNTADYGGEGYSWSLKNHADGAGIDGGTQVMAMTSHAVSLEFGHLQNYSVVDFISMYFPVSSSDGDSFMTPQAFECMLYFCIKDYRSSVSDGQFHETQQSIFPSPATTENEARAGLRLPNSVAMGKATGYANATSLQPHGLVPVTGPYAAIATEDFVLARPQSHESFVLNSGTMILLREYLQPQFTHYIAGAAQQSSDISDMAQVLYDSQLHNDGPGTLMNMLAESMTTHMRNIGNQTVSGVSTAPRTYVHVRWKWISLPVITMALTLIFLITTITMSASDKVPVWRCSSLPSLLYPLDRETANEILTYGPVISKMEKAADKFKMNMDMGEEWRLQGIHSRRLSSKAQRSSETSWFTL